jgi:hypothetical protein
MNILIGEVAMTRMMAPLALFLAILVGALAA